VTVRYDSRHPDNAVITPGLEGGDFLMAMVAAIFSFAAATLWLFLIAETVGLPRPHYGEGGVRSFMEGSRLHVRLDHFRPIMSGIALLFFCLMLGVAAGLAWLQVMGDLSLGFILAVWASVLGVPGWVAWRQYQKQESGLADLVIDPESGEIEIPLIAKPKEKTRLALSEIADVSVETIERRKPRGNVSYSHNVLVRPRSGRTITVAECGDQERAATFANWLRRKIREGGGA
jgi:hypothetical protein